MVTITRTLNANGYVFKITSGREELERSLGHTLNAPQVTISFDAAEDFPVNLLSQIPSLFFVGAKPGFAWQIVDPFGLVLRQS